MATPIHFYAFIGDRMVGGVDNTLTAPYDATDTDRFCAYSTTAQGTTTGNITRLANGTWLECVLPIAHDGVYGSADDYAMQAVKVEYTPAGIAAWVDGGAARTTLDARIAALLAVGGLQDVDDPPRDGICTAIVWCGGIDNDAAIGAPAINQAEYTALALQIVSEMRSTAWGEQSPFIAIVPGVHSSAMISQVQDANALKIRQAWMEVAARLEDVFIIDLDACTLESAAFSLPFLSADGLVELGEFIADLIDGYRQNEGGVYNGGTQRSTRSRGTGMVRFTNEDDAIAYAADLTTRLGDFYGTAQALVAGAETNIPSMRPEDPALGGLADRMFDGIHPPLELVVTSRADAIQDPVTGDWLVPIDQTCVRAGERVSTRGLGVMPTRRAPELITDGRIIDQVAGLLHRSGVQWEPDGIVAAAGAALPYWNPTATRYRRNGTHDPLAAPNAAIDGRVLYTASGYEPTINVADADFNGEDSFVFSNAVSSSVLFARGNGRLPGGRQMTFGIVFRMTSTDSTVVIAAVGVDGGLPQENSWNLVFNAGDLTLSVYSSSPTWSDAVAATETLATGTTYVAWAVVDMEDTSKILVRINGNEGEGIDFAVPLIGEMRNDLHIGAVPSGGGYLGGPDMKTPWAAYWNRTLTRTEMRLAEAALAARFGFTAPTT